MSLLDLAAAALRWVQTYNLWLSEAVRQLMFVGLAFGLITWTEQQQHTVLQAISALLTVYAAKSSVAANKVSERVDKAHAEGVAAGVAQASSGTSGRV